MTLPKTFEEWIKKLQEKYPDIDFKIMSEETINELKDTYKEIHNGKTN